MKVIDDTPKLRERGPLALRHLYRSGPVEWPWSNRRCIASNVQLCPSIVHVDLYLGRYGTDEDLRALTELDSLNRLALQDAGAISFDQGLLAALKKFGPKSLEYVKLGDIWER